MKPFFHNTSIQTTHTLVTTLKNATFVSTQIHLRGENLFYSRLFSMNYHNLKELQGLYEQGNVIVHHGKKWCTYPPFFNLFQDTHILWLHQWSKETETWKKTMWSQIISCLKQEHDNLHLKKWEYITTLSILTEPLKTSDLFNDWDGLLWKIFRATQVSPMKLLRPSLSSSKTWSLWKGKNATKCFTIGMTANIFNILVLILGTLANKFWDPKRD